MATFNTNSKPWRKIYAGEKHSYFSPDGIMLVPRASIELTDKCPAQYKQIIAACIDQGWLKSVAHMPDDEYMWEELKQ
jgi:hypothetical protein